jgi:hypothetical protein
MTVSVTDAERDAGIRQSPLAMMSSLNVREETGPELSGEKPAESAGLSECSRAASLESASVRDTLRTAECRNR